MKLFLKRSLSFIFPVMVLAALVFSVPVDRKYAYAFVNKGGCEGRSSWIFHRMAEDSTAIDVAFIGTSHSLNAVNDEQIERLYNRDNQSNYRFCVMAYCGFGRNFDYIIAKDLLLYKKPKVLVLELQESESQFGHGSFAHVAKTFDVLAAPIAFNRSYFPDIYKSFLLHLQYLREITTGEAAIHKVDIPNTIYTFTGVDRRADSVDLAERKKKIELQPKPYFSFIENGLNAYPMQYVGKIKELCDQHSIKLVMLYLPEYGHKINSAAMSQTYGPFGNIIYPPAELLDDPSNWQDYGHMNLTGSDKLSKIIVEALHGSLTPK